MTYKIHEYEDEEDVYLSSSIQTRLRPIIDPRQNLLALTDSASIQKNCGFDNICVPQLSLQHTM